MRDEGEADGRSARLSVVLDQELLERVRLRAFEERKSKSAYVRDLLTRVLNDSDVDESSWKGRT